MHSTTPHQKQTSYGLPYRSFYSRFGFVRRASSKLWLIVPILAIALLMLVLLFDYLVSGDIHFNSLMIATLTLMGVALADLLFTRYYTNRIKGIILAAEKVARGDLTVQIEDAHQDELGSLVSTFNKMVLDLDHLQHSQDLLSRTMSPAIREALIDKGLDFRNRWGRCLSTSATSPASPRSTTPANWFVCSAIITPRLPKKSTHKAGSSANMGATRFWPFSVPQTHNRQTKPLRPH